MWVWGKLGICLPVTGRCWRPSVPACASISLTCLTLVIRRGCGTSLTSLLLAAVAAVLGGARSFTAIGEWAADAPPRVLAALGVRYDPLAGCFLPPDEGTIRRMLKAVDATAVEAAVGPWLAARQPPSRAGPRERRMVAVDSKAVRGTRHASGDGQARHLLAAADQRSGAVLTQTEVDGTPSNCQYLWIKIV